ncbi:MAG: hypothetical protein K0R69_877 [Clostridia bacterium]|jgi:hypothetical protein|nr:hypothetical protein [Clostridia bacterium]
MKSNKKKKINIYAWMNKNRKTIVSVISIVLILSLLVGVFSQLMLVL